MPYDDYLQTREWKDLRNAKMEEAGHRCQVCNAIGLLEVHHRTYERRGYELIGDLCVLCVDCHEKFHDIDADLQNIE
jgi:5-methylcytosine-specific restriction endonuclease McrA